MGKIAESTKRLRSKRKQTKANESKKPRKVIPIGAREQVIQDHLLGKSKRQIARERHHSPGNVARIIAEADIESYIKETRGRFVGLGELAVKTLEAEMRKGNWELAYRFLKDSGILADIEGRAFASRVAGVDPAKQLQLTPDAMELMLSSLSAGDRRIFRVLHMVQEKARAYNMPDFDDARIMKNPAPAESAPDARGAERSQVMQQKKYEH